MRDEDVADYLQKHPQFFESHTELLETIALPHPHGGRTISLSERQLVALREKNKALETKLHELLNFARENDELQNKVHQFTCALFDVADLDVLQDTITYQLRERFAVPHVALRLWEVAPPSAEALTFADQTPQPVCLHQAMYDTLEWFGESGPHLRSFAYIPLREGNGAAVGAPAASPLRGLREAESSIGLLILASEDPQRFYPEMGTLFLQRIAEIVSAAAKPYL